MVSFTPRLLYPQGKSPWYSLDRRLIAILLDSLISDQLIIIVVIRL
jgi:hypothetical protein